MKIQSNFSTCEQQIIMNIGEIAVVISKRLQKNMQFSKIVEMILTFERR